MSREQDKAKEYGEISRIFEFLSIQEAAEDGYLSGYKEAWTWVRVYEKTKAFVSSKFFKEEDVEQIAEYLSTTFPGLNDFNICTPFSKKTKIEVVSIEVLQSFISETYEKLQNE